MKILIIDDDPEICNMLEMFFESLEHKTMSVNCGIDGLKQTVIYEPDIVFLDVKLPDRDGVEVLKEMKEINKNLPVIVITGYKDAEKVIDAFRYGAVDCILKPFNFDYIKNLLPHIKIHKIEK